MSPHFGQSCDPVIGQPVLSDLTTQFLPADVAPELVRATDDRLAAARVTCQRSLCRE